MYQTLLDDVPGISVHNARCLTPEHVAAAFLEAGWRVQHIADRIRMQGIGQKGGWFCDLDQLWFGLQRAKPGPASGYHIAASNYVTKYRGGKRKWYINYLRRQGEQLYISVPFHFPCNSPICVTGLILQILTQMRFATCWPSIHNFGMACFLSPSPSSKPCQAHLITWLEEWMQGPPPPAAKYNRFMDECEAALWEWGLQRVCFLEHSVCCPLSHQESLGKSFFCCIIFQQFFLNSLSVID